MREMPGKSKPTQDTGREAVQALSTVAYFGALEAEALKDIARAAVRQTYEAGEVVFPEGEPGGGLCVVQSG